MSQKENLRSQFPELALLMDDLRENFGPVRLTYLKGGRVELGRPSDKTRQVAMSDDSDISAVRRDWYEQVKLRSRSR